VLIFSPRRQRIGDLLSRTFVVQKQGLDAFIAQQAAAAVRGETPPENLPVEPDKKEDGRSKSRTGRRSRPKREGTGTASVLQ